MKKLIILTLMLLLLAVTVNAEIMSFGNEEVQQDLTSFKWCWTPDFSTDKELYKDNLELVIKQSDSECSITNRRLYAVTPVTYITKECSKTPPQCVDEEVYHTKNKTTTTVTSCTSKPDVCKDVINTIYEEYDLEKTDYLFSRDSRICYTANRDISINQGKCDIGFDWDFNNDGTIYSADTDFNKVWWNATWSKYYFLNVSAEVSAPYTPFKIIINSSYIDVNDCQADFGDLRIVNFTEDGVVDFNISSIVAGVSAILYINEDISTEWLGYLYCNASTPQTTTSISIDITLTDDLWVYYKADEGTGNLIDAEGNYDGVETGTVPNNNPFNGSGSRGVFADANIFTIPSGYTETQNFTYSFWLNYTGGGNFDTITYGGAVAGEWLQNFRIGVTPNIFEAIMYKNGGTTCGVASTTAITPNTFTHFVVRHWANNTFDIFQDGSYEASENCPLETASAVTTIWLGKHSAGGYALDGGVIDEWGQFNSSMTDAQITALYNSGNYLDHPFYYFAEPVFAFGVGVSSLTPTDLGFGVYNKSWVNVSLVDEGDNFKPFANWTWDDNSTAITNDTGTCRYSVDLVLHEAEDEQVGVNTTVCDSGCDYSNRSFVFTDLHVDGVQRDIYKFRLCHPANPRTFHIATNCSETHTFAKTDAVACDVGYTTIEIESTACIGSSDVEMSLWSDGVNINNALTMHDDFMEIDREVNLTNEEMVYNSTTETWIEEHWHEIYDHGSKTFSFNCTIDSTEHENKTSTFDLTVVNVAPVMQISSVWDWFSGISNANGLLTKYYPLTSTINISGVATDDDLQACVMSLYFENNDSLIHSETWFDDGDGLLSGSINFTQSNFSTNLTFLDGTNYYLFNSSCNDSEGLTASDSQTFKAINNVPVGTWSDGSSILIGSTPNNFSYSCTDTEGETLTAYILVNGTLNESSSPPVSGFDFSYPTGVYNLSLLCEDSFRNSTTSSLIVTFVEECVISLTNPQDGFRYADNNIDGLVNCSNGVAVTSCFYTVNNFAAITILNCSEFTIVAERGWNVFNFSVVAAGLTTSSTINFWAKDADASIFDFPVIWFMLSIMVLGFVLGRWYNVFYLMAGFGGVIVGFQLIAFSMYLGVGFAVMSALIGVLLVWKG